MKGDEVVLSQEIEAQWTEDVVLAAKSNNAYDYVLLPDDDTHHSIDEFLETFLQK